MIYADSLVKFTSYDFYLMYCKLYILSLISILKIFVISLMSFSHIDK